MTDPLRRPAEREGGVTFAPPPAEAPLPAVEARRVPAVARAGAARRPHVVIVGGGFGGLRAARALGKAPVEVTLVDRTNHHLFQPLLYQVATAVLAPSDITIPIRYLLRRQKNATVLMAEARDVDLERRIVFLDEDRKELTYDYLVLAAGTRHSYFGRDEWEDVAPGLKSIMDAYELRRRFLTAFEEAEKTPDRDEKTAWLTFVVIGGGPTGVELAGTLFDTARAFRRDFRHIDTCRTRVVLVEGGPRVLAAFPEDLSARALSDLEELGVEVQTGSMVTRIEPDAVYVGDQRIATRTVFWAAGNAASPLGLRLGVPVDRSGRVLVEPDLSLPGHPEVFAVGDMAAFVDRGVPVPGVAPAANQEGNHAARNILASVRGEPRREFRYTNKGELATIGRYRAVAKIGDVRLKGALAWWFWLFLHLLYLVGFRNRVSVLVQWAYAYFTYQRGVRLISGAMARERKEGAPVDAPAASPPVPGWK